MASSSTLGNGAILMETVVHPSTPHNGIRNDETKLMLKITT